MIIFRADNVQVNYNWYYNRSTEYNSYSYTYCVLTMNQVLRSLHVRIYLIFITMQSMGRLYYYPHFTEEKNQEQRA